MLSPTDGELPEIGASARGEGGADGPIVLVTGSTEGLGREVARRLAAQGAHVIVHGRDRGRGEAVVAEIEAEGIGRARFHAADLATVAGARELAEAIAREHERLDVLVNNAGIWLPSGPRQTSADGHELHFAVNYLAGYLLTRTLMPLLEGGRPSMIVNVASGAQTAIDFGDVMLERGYTGSRAYAQSKLAQIMFTFDLAEELASSGVRATALHPATLMDTPMVRSAGVAPRSSVDEGTDAVVRLVCGEGVASGQYFDGLRPARAHAQAYDRAARERLRRLSAELTDVS